MLKDLNLNQHFHVDEAEIILDKMVGIDFQQNNIRQLYKIMMKVVGY